MKKHSNKSRVISLFSRGINKALKPYQAMTCRFRVLPHFIVIGAQKCGTTSMYKYLIKHPSIISAYRNEVHYFDQNFKKGICWYRSNFPSSLYMKYFQKISKNIHITGEASPYYIFHPLVPKRVFDLLPKIKLIALLRNPVDRAYSHYNHEMRKGRETLTFKDAIDKETERLSGESRKMLRNKNYYSYNHHRYSYLARGIYINQLKVWMDFFPKEQILIIKSEDLFNKTQEIMNQVTDFLNLPQRKMSDNKKYNVFKYQKMDPKVRIRLSNYFRPHNQRLYKYLDRDFGWD